MKDAEKSDFKRYGLIGRKISYSFSPEWFREKFKNENIQASYKLFDINQIQQFPSVFLTPGLKGLNVTIPYKEEIMVFMDDLSPEAETIGAVNTIAFKGDRLIGHNTDWIGFRDSLSPLLQEHHNRALILGTGGSAKAVKFALEWLNIPYQSVSRQPGAADFIYTDLNEYIISEHPLIINTTPLGTEPDIDMAPEIPYEFLTASHLVYDLIYNPEKTKLLQLAEMHGAAIKNGLEMLKIQAEESWKIWNRNK